MNAQKLECTVSFKYCRHVVFENKESFICARPACNDDQELCLYHYCQLPCTSQKEFKCAFEKGCDKTTVGKLLCENHRKRGSVPLFKRRPLPK